MTNIEYSIKDFKDMVSILLAHPTVEINQISIKSTYIYMGGGDSDVLNLDF